VIYIFCAALAPLLEPEKNILAKAKFLQLEQQGILRRSNSPSSSPLHMVHKKLVDGDTAAIIAM
jgi:hypothetical protein